MLSDILTGDVSLIVFRNEFRISPRWRGMHLGIILPSFESDDVDNLIAWQMISSVDELHLFYIAFPQKSSVGDEEI